MKFVPVDPSEVPNMRDAHRGRVSYPILKSFMETNMVVAKLDRTGMQQSLQALTSSLGAYIRNHGLPIKMFMRGGEIYLMRLDLNNDGSPNKDYKGPQGAIPSNGASTPAPEVTADEVARRFKEEKGKVTK